MSHHFYLTDSLILTPPVVRHPERKQLGGPVVRCRVLGGADNDEDRIGTDFTRLNKEIKGYVEREWVVQDK